MISAQICTFPQLNTSAHERGLVYRLLDRKLHNEVGIATGSVTISEAIETLRDRADLFIASEHHAVFAGRL